MPEDMNPGGPGVVYPGSACPGVSGAAYQEVVIGFFC